MKQTNASPKHSSWVYYLGTLAMLASMLLLPHLIPSWADGITPAAFMGAVSYTHLTLPTICRV